MAYITLQNVSDRLGEEMLVQLTDNAGTGEVDANIVNDAIEAAQGEFESYLRTRYSLPVPSTPLVRQLNLKLAIFTLFENRATLDEGIYKVHQNAYNNAITRLKDIAAGKAALDVPAIEETKENPATSDEILTNASRSKFTDAKLSGF